MVGVNMVGRRGQSGMNLRKRAQGQDCYLRLPYHCTFDETTTVLAHIRRGNVAGVGQKPSNFCAVPACGACHDVLDGRVKSDFVSHQELDSYLLEAQQRWLADCHRNGWIREA